MSSTLCKKLGLRIKELRESKGIKQVQLAELINMEPSNLSKLENGNQFPKEENLEKIATVLEVNLKDLFDFEHKQSHKDIKRYITNLLDSLTQTQLEFLYKIIINLKYIK